MVLIDEPQSLVSYHLRLLREGGLVIARRSSADRRDSYYTIDLIACRESLQSAGSALHPSLRLAAAAPGYPRTGGTRRRPRVLFLCTGNSARSQIAEALLERMSAGSIHAVSAGSHPKPLHPNAVRVLRSYGIDISANRTKHLDEFAVPAIRHGDHPVRSRSRGLPGVPIATRARPLERSRPGARGCDRPRLVSGIRAHRSRARDPHQLPASSAHRHANPRRTSSHAER